MSSFTEKLLRIRRGEQDALDVLLARWRPLLRLDARSLLDSRFVARVDPSDVVQETMTQAYRDASQFRGQTEGEWIQWLRRILEFQASKLKRAHLAAKRTIVKEQASSNHTAADVVDARRARSASTHDPLDTILTRDEMARMAAAIDRLNDKMQTVVMRRVFDQASFDEIAGELNCSAGAARVTWTRAIRKLREILETDDATDETLVRTMRRKEETTADGTP